MPPPLGRTSGRPKKSRRKSEEEAKNPAKVRKKYTYLRYRRCGEFGHNVRTCKRTPVAKTKKNTTTPSGSAVIKGGGTIDATRGGGTIGTTREGVVSMLQGK